MATIKTIATICLLLAGLLAANAAKAEGPQNVAPAMRLQDLPPTPAEASGKVPRLTAGTPGGGAAHFMPTPAISAARKAAAESIGIQPLNYHSGGSVMSPVLQIYEIFWGPALLQNGTPTPGYSPLYGKILGSLGAYYSGHGLMNLTTQYFQTIGGVTTYIQNGGGLAGFFIDKSPLPASGCTDSFTPGNCITDAQVQTEITSAMAKNGWTGGLNKIFLLFTPNGEGSCLDSTSAMCAYKFYCAYHGFFTSGGQTIIYANLPYANTSVCKAPGQTEPNGDVGDLVASSASHEITEAVTDPLLNAWFDSSGREIGDVCNFIYGTNTWPGPSALGNQSWNGFVFELQQEYDNNAGACASVGPQ
jgi:Phosphate-induced protein 1 conserved region